MRPLNSTELEIGYSTRLWLDFYSLPNLFLLNFYSKSFYIFAPSMKITNIFNFFTWLNFNRKFIKKIPLKDFLPLFLFPKLKTSVKKRKVLYGSGLYRRPYKSIYNYWKLSKKIELRKDYSISPLGNYTLHPQFNKYRILFSNSQYKLKTPQIRAKLQRFEQPSASPFFKNPNIKKIYKTRKFLFKTKKNYYRRALFLNLITNLTKSVRIIRSKGRYKTNLKHYIKVRRGRKSKNKKKHHLLPRQYSFLYSSKKPSLRFNKSMGMKLFRRICIIYKRRLRQFTTRMNKSRLLKSRSLRFRWRSRTIAKRVRFCISNLFFSPSKIPTKHSTQVILSNLIMVRRRKTKRIKRSKRVLSRVLLRYNSLSQWFRVPTLLKSLLKYYRKSRLRFVKRKKLKRLRGFKTLLLKKILLKKTKATVNPIFKGTSEFLSNIKPFLIQSLLKLNPTQRYENRRRWLQRQAPYKKRVYIRKIIRRKAKNIIKIKALKRARHRYNIWAGLANSNKNKTTLNLDSNGFESVTKFELSKLPIKFDKKPLFNRYLFEFISNSSITYDDSDEILNEIAYIEDDLKYFFRVDLEDSNWYFEDWDSRFYLNNFFYKKYKIITKNSHKLVSYENALNQYYKNWRVVYDNYSNILLNFQNNYAKDGVIFTVANNPLLINNDIFRFNDVGQIYLNNLAKKYQQYKYRINFSKQILLEAIIKRVNKRQWRLNEVRDLFFKKNSLLNNFKYKMYINQPYFISKLVYLPKFRHKININNKSSRKGIFITSQHKIPFIFSSFGFLFVNSGQLYSTASRFLKNPSIQPKINKYRYSFFYKNDIKRLYLRRPGKLKMVSSLLNQGNFFKNKYLQFNTFGISNNPITGLSQIPNENTIAGSHCISPHLIPFLNEYFLNTVGTGWPTQNRIKRIRFKPGYSRIWRKAREAINYTLRLNVRYQYRLSRRLHRLKYTSTHFAIKLTDWNLSQLVLNSRFVYDLSTSNLLIKSHLVFVNGTVTDNPNLILYVGDFIQLIVSLKFYIISRWLINWNLHNKLKLNKLSRSKNNKSRRDMSKQKSNHLPDWIFTIGYKQVDIPKYLEVDYFTLSSFIIYEANTINNLNPLIHVEARPTILNMYNWKYIN